MDSPGGFSCLSVSSPVSSPMWARQPCPSEGRFSFAASECSDWTGEPSPDLDLSRIDECEAMVPLASPPYQTLLRRGWNWNSSEAPQHKCDMDDQNQAQLRTPDSGYLSMLSAGQTMADRTLDLLGHSVRGSPTPGSLSDIAENESLVSKRGTSPRMQIKRDCAWMRSPPRRLRLAFPDADSAVSPTHGYVADLHGERPQDTSIAVAQLLRPGFSNASEGMDDPILCEADLLSPLQIASSADVSLPVEWPQEMAVSVQQLDPAEAPPTLSAEESEHSFEFWDSSLQAQISREVPRSAALPGILEPLAVVPETQARDKKALLMSVVKLLRLFFLVQGLVSLLWPRWIAPAVDAPRWSWADDSWPVEQNESLLLSLGTSEDFHTSGKGEVFVLQQLDQGVALPSDKDRVSSGDCQVASDKTDVIYNPSVDEDDDDNVDSANASRVDISAPDWIEDLQSHSTAIVTAMAAFVMKRLV